MTWLFSKRCKQSLHDKKFEVSIPCSVKVRLWITLLDYNEMRWESTDTNFNYQVSILEILPGFIEAELGLRELLAFPPEGGEPKPSDIEGFVLRGNYPPYLFDAIEIFYNNLREDKDKFQTCINSIMEESDLPWRMASGKIFPMDSSYLDEVIMRRASRLLDEIQFHGALEEFERARVDLANSRPEGAIQNANLAVESTIKEILGVQRLKPGELFRGLIDSGIVPEYFKGFLTDFEKNILRRVAIIRNEELGVGHGKGPSKEVVPLELAELAVYLSGVLINFLIKQYLSKIGAETITEGKADTEDISF